MTFDWTILQFIQDHIASPGLDPIMVFVSQVGNRAFIWVLAGFFLLIQKKYRKQALVLFLALLAGQLLSNMVLKNLVQRARPCWIDTTVQLLIEVPKDFSFPSGHSMFSAIGAGLLTWTDRRLGIIAIPLALLIAFSRLYLYVHFPTDVLAGLLIGLTIAWLAGRLARKYERNKISLQKS